MMFFAGFVAVILFYHGDTSPDTDRLIKEIDDLKALVRDLNSTVVKLKSENEMTMSELKRHYSKYHLATNRTYAFYAYTTQRQFLYPQQPVIFDYVETNIGNHYSAITGRFTAPVRGLYFFAGNIMSVPGQYAHLEMVQNGRRVSSIFAPQKGGGLDDNTGSAVLNLLLQRGDQVWIRDENDPEGEGAVDYTYAMYSGFLISESV